MLGWADQPAQPLSSIDLFLAGHSIPALSAAAGQDMIERQRQIEAEIRDFIRELQYQIAELQADLDTCNSPKR